MMKNLILLTVILLTTIPCRGAKVEMKPDGIMLLNGKPQFVYGTYRDPSDDWKDFSGIKKAGFNLVHDYYFENARGYKKGADGWIKDAREYLALAKKHQVGVFMGIPRELIRKMELDEIRKLIEAVKEEDALWFWYLYDEPSHSKRNKWNDKYTVDQILKNVYQLIKSVDPDHPVIIVDSYRYIREYPEAVQHCDVIGSDRYAVPYSSTYIAEDIENIKNTFPKKAVWGVPAAATLRPYAQNHVRKKYSDQYYVPANIYNNAKNNTGAKEINSQFHACVSGGAYGVIWYWLPSYMVKIDRDTPAAWDAIGRLGRLVEELTPVLLSEEPFIKKPEVSYDTWGLTLRNEYLFKNSLTSTQIKNIPGVRYWQRMYQKELYMGFTVDYTSTRKIVVKLPFKLKKLVQYPGGKTVLEVVDGKLKLNHKALPVQIWQVKKDMTEIAFVMEELDSVVWKFEKEENLSDAKTAGSDTIVFDEAKNEE